VADQTSSTIAAGFTSAISGYTQAINGAIQTAFSIYEEWKSTQDHPLATEWVARVQNPFGAQLAVIVDRKDAAITAGTATADDIYFAQQAVTQIWNGYQQIASQFAALGPGQSQVIEQSYNTLTPIVNQILRDMDVQIAQRGGISSAARLGVNVSHFWILIVIAFLFVITLVVMRELR
jgi:hypothetical protein